METRIDATYYVLLFKNNSTIEQYKDIVEKNFNDYSKCIDCHNHIFYYDTHFVKDKKTLKLKINGKSYNSFKIVNNKTYYLRICEECLIKKYPDYLEKNRPKVFNTCNKFSKYAYAMSDEDFEKQKNFFCLRTEETYMEKFGEIEGKKRWKNYCDKQAYSNSYEYKKEKHNWTEDQFNDFNKLRATTLENFIKRYGKREGKSKWKKYCDNLSNKNSKETFIKNHGEDRWNDLCKEKSHTFENYIKWYGSEEEAKKKWNDKINNYSNISKASQKFFNNLYDEFIKKYNVNVVYHSKDGYEESISANKNIYYIDFFIPDWKIAVEFKGTIFHADPNRFKDEDVVPIIKKTAREIRDEDLIREKNLKDFCDITTISVWEKEAKDLNISNLIKLIYESRNESSI